MEEIELTTDSDEKTATLLMAVTFTLTGEFYDWLHMGASPDDRTKLMQHYPRPGDLFMRVLGPWAIDVVKTHGDQVNDRLIGEMFEKEFSTRLWGDIEVKKEGIGNEVGSPGVQQGPPPAPQTVTEDAS